MWRCWRRFPKARANGIYYGISDKTTRSKKLSTNREKRNRQKSIAQTSVEPVSGFMKNKLKVTKVGAKTGLRNALRFDMRA